MDSKSKEEATPPQCLKLRIHSSILFGSTSENEIHLPSDIAFCSTQKSDSTNSRDGRVFKVEENTGVGYVYVSANKETANQRETNNDNNKNRTSRFDFLTSSASERILVQPSVDGIDELGRRARARTEHQRQNRKGIKVIEGTSLIVEQARKEAAKAKAPSTNNANSGRKRPRQKPLTQIQQLSSTKVARKWNKLFWIPDISQIPTPPKGIQSTYVQLHGLPVGSTFETVRRFFTGLVPERILVVLSNRVYISNLDASSYDDLSSFDLQTLVYTNMDVRVLVKFDSAVAADLAADRSGETVSAKNITAGKSQEHKGVDDHRRESFSIGVTKLSKEMAFSLSKLSIGVPPGVPFHDWLSGVESKLHPRVREILWTGVGEAFWVPLDDKIQKANLQISAADHEEQRSDKISLFSFTQYKRHSIHYNRLLRIQEDIMTSMPSEMPDVEASISMNPITRLSSLACTIIDNELDRIDSLLYQYRVSRFV